MKFRDRWFALNVKLLFFGLSKTGDLSISGFVTLMSYHLPEFAQSTEGI
jgi:hypothetical protein